MKSILTRATLVLAVSASSISAHAQYEKVPGFVKQAEIGVGFSFCSADYIIKSKGVTPEGRSVDTSITTHTKTKGGITETFGTSLRLKRLGVKSTLALGIDLTYSGYIWDFHTPSNITFNDSGFKYYYDSGLPVFDGATFTAGGLLTADIKFGAEAMMDKGYRWGWTIGAGVFPSVSATAATGLDATIAFGIQPVVKTEVALRGPIVAKLRLQYSFGKITYLDYTPPADQTFPPGTTQQTQILGKSNFTVSLLFMPMSWMYKKSEWFNSY
jgi:hypothetical protein